VTSLPTLALQLVPVAGNRAAFDLDAAELRAS
jgi:hypothetical protein